MSKEEGFRMNSERVYTIRKACTALLNIINSKQKNSVRVSHHAELIHASVEVNERKLKIIRKSLTRTSNTKD